MSSILDLAKPAKDTVESVNMMLYGDSGAGKTCFAGSGRDNGKNDLIVAIEHGTVSTARLGSEANVLPIESWDQLMELVTAIEDEPDRFDWVIIDSLTKMQDLIWRDIVDKAVQKNPARSEFTKELQEYGEAQERLMNVVERLNGCDANIVYTALADLATDEESNEFKMPSLHGRQGKIAAWVCAQMDLVGYISVIKRDGKIHRKFQFNKTPEIFAKDRFSVFSKPALNLTLEKLTNKLEESSVETPTDKENTDGTEA